MAIKTIFRKNRPDIPIEIKGLRKNHQGKAKHKQIWKPTGHLFYKTPLSLESQMFIVNFCVKSLLICVTQPTSQNQPTQEIHWGASKNQFLLHEEGGLANRSS
jgi:hypothetical protein